MDKYEGLAGYLQYLQGKFGLEISINDYAGFLDYTADSYHSLQPFLLHRNDYCMFVKSHQVLWDRCLEKKKSILQKCKKMKKPFYGMCYCGVEEYIIPILHNDITAGFICAGRLHKNKAAANFRMRKISKNYGIGLTALQNKYGSSSSGEIPAFDEVNAMLGIVAEYFSAAYASQLEKNRVEKAPAAKKPSNEAYILSHAVEYIKQNFNQNLDVPALASYCHCSCSYINHIFKKQMNENVKAYINRLRIDHARLYLIDSQESITTIALKVGFNDPNYFTIVFNGITGMTPTQFRKNCSNK